MKTLLTTLIFCISNIAAFSQTKSLQSSPPLAPAPPAVAGMSAERLDRIDSMLEEAIQAGQIPGAVALVARNGKIVYHKAFGMADPETGRKMKTDDIFRIASQTKAVTATAVMMLWEEGKFRLDDPIAKFIPEFREVMVLESFHPEDSSYTARPADKPITIRHLLTHTSGLGYGMIDNDTFRKIYQKAGITDAFTTLPLRIGENVKNLAGMPLHFNPGEKYRYCLGLDVLGYLVEILSGQTLDEFFRERIFDPLGMNDTYFYLPAATASRLVPVMTRKDNEWKKLSETPYYDPDYPVKGAKTYYAGGAGLSSTPPDYATFLQMYLNKGELNGVRLLSRTTVEFMMENQIGDLWEGRGAHYGLAFGVVNPEGASRGEKGSAGTFYWGGYFNTQYFADPEEQLIGILMKQTRESGTDDTGWKFPILAGQAIDD